MRKLEANEQLQFEKQYGGLLRIWRPVWICGQSFGWYHPHGELGHLNAQESRFHRLFSG